ncbi:MAG: hypothetical protein QOI09_924 [Chloroflexota bacterium]|nr:hypothetical protein [Chloroflexota bacterium]
MTKRVFALLASVGLLMIGAIPATAANINSQNAFVVTNLQSDVAGRAAHTDPDLVNGWGIAALPMSPWWVADNGTHRSTLYSGVSGLKLGLVVDVAGDGGPADPTGLVANNSSEFAISAAAGTPATKFIFDSEDGTVSAWNGGTTSVVKATSTNGAIYKGLATGSVGSGADAKNYLYATDFHNNHVDVYDGSFSLKDWGSAFVDPGLPAGYAPFGIQNLGGRIFVTFAKQDAEAKDEIAGPGLGFVSVFGTDGSFIGRVASGGDLNAPWGLAWAPSSWERFGGHLLVGNFGDGRINGYRGSGGSWEARGHLKGTNHQPVVVDGLWGIGFGNGAAAGPATTLYFAAGPDGEAHGLFGSISAP